MDPTFVRVRPTITCARPQTGLSDPVKIPKQESSKMYPLTSGSSAIPRPRQSDPLKHQARGAQLENAVQKMNEKWVFFYSLLWVFALFFIIYFSLFNETLCSVFFVKLFLGIGSLHFLPKVYIWEKILPISQNQATLGEPQRRTGLQILTKIVSSTQKVSKMQNSI